MSAKSPNANCQQCSKKIYRRPNQIAKAKAGVYCGRSCYGLATRNPRPCVACGKPIPGALRKKTCNAECAKANFLNPERLHSKGRKPGAATRGSTRSFRSRILKLRGNTCQTCGYNSFDVLNIHHIIERCNGGTDEDANILLVCPTCHAEIHKGYRKIGAMLER